MDYFSVENDGDEGGKDKDASYEEEDEDDGFARGVL